MSTDTIASIVPASARNRTVRPWFVVPFEALPLPIVWAAAGLSTACYALTLLVLPEESTSRFIRLGAVVWGMITYSIVTVSVAIRAARRDLESLRLQLDCDDDKFELLARSITRQTVRSMVGAALVGAAVALAVAYYLTSAGIIDSELPMSWLVYPQAVLQWVVAISTIWIFISIGLVFRRIGTNLLRVDLFDLEVLAPFQRVGLRTALIIFGLFSIRILALRPDNVGYLVVTSGIMLGLGTLAVLLPLRGAHVGIRAAKQSELTAIGEAIRREPTRSGEGSVRVSRQLLDLLEYRERVQSVREWLFGAPALLRFLLYLGIPVLGWIGGALVERLFDTVVAL